MIKLYQIYYKFNQIKHLENAFIRYDNTKNPRPKECEFFIFLKEYLNNKINDEDITGYFSWKFKNKTQVSGRDFKKYIENNSGYDFYYINPFSFFMYIHYNTWDQGENCHPGINSLVNDIFSKIGYDTQLISSQRHHINNSTFCNYWAGNKKFWDRYISWFTPIYEYIQKNDDPDFKYKMFNENDKLGHFPYIMERLINTFINLKENKDLKILRYKNNIYVNCNVSIKKEIENFKKIIDYIDGKNEYSQQDLTLLNFIQNTIFNKVKSILY